MTDLLVIRSSFTDPRVHEFGAPSPAAHDDDVERTPPRDETKPKENRPSDPVSRTMKAVLSCSPGNPKNQRKTKIRALRWGTQVLHALAGDEIMASSKPGSPVGKQAAGDMVSVSPRLSPRVRRSKHWKKRKDVHIGSNTQEAEEAYEEENIPLLGDESGKQANGMSPKMRRSKQWQQQDIQGDSNTEEATEAFEGKDSIPLRDKRQSTDIDPSCADDVEEAYTEENSPLLGDKSGKQANEMSPKMTRSKQWQQHEDVDGDSNKQQATEAYKEKDSLSSPPGNLLVETGKWTGEKRAKVIASPPTSEVAQEKQIDDPRDNEEFWDVYDDPEQLKKVHERLALYRIKAHELFWEGKELDIAKLKEEYSSDTLHEEGYFEHYEMNCEWYFNAEYCERSAFDDYQRLVLHNDVRYISWESYHTTCTTLKCDQEFLQFYEELSSKLKSIEVDDVEPDKAHFDAQRRRYEIKAHIEAPKIVARFSSIYADLFHMGITDCTWSAMFDLTYHKDLDHIFFEIWKRVAKDKVSFTDALLDVYKLDLYPLQHRFIKAELEERPLRSIKMKEAYYAHVAPIDEKVPEDEVVVMIKEAVNKILPKPLIYVDYIRKKLEVAKEIGVIP